MADQLTPFMMGTYGHPQIKTPNLDALAARGVRFDCAYANSPICGPSRASLITGRFISRIRVYDNAAPFGSDIPTLAHYLTNEGYETVVSGKMHFVGPDQLHGFHRRLTTDIYPSNFAWVSTRENKDQTMFKGRAHAAPYAAPRLGPRPTSLGLAFDEETHFRALEFLRARAENDSPWYQPQEHKPLFMVISYHHPHDPFNPPQEYWDLYANTIFETPEITSSTTETYSAMDRWLHTFNGSDQVPHLLDTTNLQQMRRSYASLVTYIDHKVGEIIRTLKQVGMYENTTIIFTSDHGDMLGEKGLIGKKLFYEWSARVPLILSFPFKDYGISNIITPVSLIDLAPTIMELAGIDRKQTLDGHSLLTLLKGKEDGSRDVLCEMHAEGVYAPCFMLRRDRYKYIYIHGHGEQLFDLVHDPQEMKDLSREPSSAEIMHDLREDLFKRFVPDAIENDVRESLRNRQLIREAMRKTETTWDYTPVFNASRQYVRQYGSDTN